MSPESKSVSCEEKDPLYFNYYGQLQNQQNMLEDQIRTEAYYKAIHGNRSAIEGKVVLDVGTGTGILSFFAAQAGAKRVYAVEGSEGMARNAQILVDRNGLSEVIKVISGKIEEVEIPEEVDVIISEPMGVLLFHERMIESFLYARDKFLRRSPDSVMIPGSGTISLAPFTDGAMYADFGSRTKFWSNESFYGVDLSSMKDICREQIFRQPVVGGFDPNTLMSATKVKSFDFGSLSIADLHDISLEFDFELESTGVIHGLAGWFDVDLGGGMVLETGPKTKRTHWQQCRFFFRRPIGVNAGQRFCGELRMRVNEERSYNVIVKGQVNGIIIEEAFALHEQQYFNLNPTEYPEVTSKEDKGYYNLF